MRSLVLIALFISCVGNAEVIRRSVAVPFVMGGSHVTITGIQIEEDVQIKCLVRFPDGRDSIELEPSIPRDRRSAICRVPPEINTGSIDIDLEITANNWSTKKVIHYGSFFINPSPVVEVEVKENWTRNELVFTWDPEYFKQFFKPDASIMIQATLYVSENKEPVFTASGVVILAGANRGIAKVSITNANKDKISKLLHPYYYVLRPVGTQSNVFLSSAIFMSTNAHI